MNNKIYLERYEKGAKKPHYTNENKNFCFNDLYEYLLKKVAYNKYRVKTTYHYNDTYTISFTDKDNGYKTVFYNVPKKMGLSEV